MHWWYILWITGGSILKICDVKNLWIFGVIFTMCELRTGLFSQFKLWNIRLNDRLKTYVQSLYAENNNQPQNLYPAFMGKREIKNFLFKIN